MREISLANGKGVVKVDDEDFPVVSQIKWHRHPRGYAYGWVSKDGTKRKELMHRVILGLSGRANQADHINHDKLDNRRENLRRCTNMQNHANKPKPRARVSNFIRYKGVRRSGTPSERWCAAIRTNYKTIHLGSFGTQEEAALAYNRAAVELFGEFACLNEVPAVAA